MTDIAHNLKSNFPAILILGGVGVGAGLLLNKDPKKLGLIGAGIGVAVAAFGIKLPGATKVGWSQEGLELQRMDQERARRAGEHRHPGMGRGGRGGFEGRGMEHHHRHHMPMMDAGGDDDDDQMPFEQQQHHHHHHHPHQWW